MSPRLVFALDAAYRAGRSTLALFDTGAAVEMKGDTPEEATPVTEADKGAEEIIRAAIEAAYPGESVLGEEQGLTGAGDDRWIVDPIDGTKAFIAGVPLYATLLSYEVAARPVLGVCYVPALDLMVHAEVGGGAFWNGRPIRVSPTTSLTQAALACGGHSSMIKTGRWKGFETLVAKTLTTRTWQDAYGHALVASGRIAGMVDPRVSRWDISAMIPIVEEAGGRATDFDGGDPLARADDDLEIVTCAPGVQAEILQAFAR